eukprot:g34628.t1
MYQSTVNGFVYEQYRQIIVNKDIQIKKTYTEAYRSPGQVVSYHHSKELDVVHLANISSIEVDGHVFSSFLSEVKSQFFNFAIDGSRESSMET